VPAALEVEVKARADPEAVRRRLGELGATPLGVEEQEDVYYEHPCRRMLEADEALRLRLSGSRAELTYKGPRSGDGAKSRLELTLRVDDPAAARAILERLGFREAIRVRKRREVYRLGRALVSIDEVEGLGAFVEVEGVSEAEALDLLERLGAREVVRETYPELLAARGLGNPSYGATPDDFDSGLEDPPLR